MILSSDLVEKLNEKKITYQIEEREQARGRAELQRLWEWKLWLHNSCNHRRPLWHSLVRWCWGCSSWQGTAAHDGDDAQQRLVLSQFMLSISAQNIQTDSRQQTLFRHWTWATVGLCKKSAIAQLSSFNPSTDKSLSLFLLTRVQEDLYCIICSWSFKI